MILWCDGAHDAPENMRRDEALLNSMESRSLPAEAVLRLFEFDPPGITLGRAQDAHRELDLERCRRDGVRWAIRPTGGRAIFHAEEWTYSLISSIDDPAWGGTLAQAFGKVSRLILASLGRLGIEAGLAPGMTSDSGPRAARGPAPPCFASTTRHEITRDGRKLVGSAQRRASRTLLQQGSVLLSEGHERLADYLALTGPEREGTRHALRTAAAHIGDVVGRDAALERWADALVASLPAGTRRLDGAEAFALTA